MTKTTNTTPPLRKAATIILVRQKNNTLEVYLLKRSSKSKFMGKPHYAKAFGLAQWAGHHRTLGPPV